MPSYDNTVLFSYTSEYPQMKIELIRESAVQHVVRCQYASNTPRVYKFALFTDADYYFHKEVAFAMISTQKLPEKVKRMLREFTAGRFDQQ